MVPCDLSRHRLSCDIIVWGITGTIIEWNVKLRSAKRRTRKALQKIYIFSILATQGGRPGSKFTDPDSGVQQGPLYQSDKFRPVLATPLRDICCQSYNHDCTLYKDARKVKRPSMMATYVKYIDLISPTRGSNTIHTHI